MSAAQEAVHWDTQLFDCPACATPITNRDEVNDGGWTGVYGCPSPYCRWEGGT